jgi:hypothetical protein
MPLYSPEISFITICAYDSSRITIFITAFAIIDQMDQTSFAYTIGLRYTKESRENSIEEISIIHSPFLS